MSTKTGEYLEISVTKDGKSSFNKVVNCRNSEVKKFKHDDGESKGDITYITFDDGKSYWVVSISQFEAKNVQ